MPSAIGFDDVWADYFDFDSVDNGGYAADFGANLLAGQALPVPDNEMPHMLHSPGADQTSSGPVPSDADSGMLVTPDWLRAEFLPDNLVGLSDPVREGQTPILPTDEWQDAPSSPDWSTPTPVAPVPPVFSTNGQGDSSSLPLGDVATVEGDLSYLDGLDFDGMPDMPPSSQPPTNAMDCLDFECMPDMPSSSQALTNSMPASGVVNELLDRLFPRSDVDCSQLDTDGMERPVSPWEAFETELLRNEPGCTYGTGVAHSTPTNLSDVQLGHSRLSEPLHPSALAPQQQRQQLVQGYRNQMMAMSSHIQAGNNTAATPIYRFGDSMQPGLDDFQFTFSPEVPGDFVNASSGGHMMDTEQQPQYMQAPSTVDQQPWAIPNPGPTSDNSAWWNMPSTNPSQPSHHNNSASQGGPHLDWVFPFVSDGPSSTGVGVWPGAEATDLGVANLDQGHAEEGQRPAKRARTTRPDALKDLPVPTDMRSAALAHLLPLPNSSGASSYTAPGTEQSSAAAAAAAAAAAGPAISNAARATYFKALTPTAVGKVLYYRQERLTKGAMYIACRYKGKGTWQYRVNNRPIPPQPEVNISNVTLTDNDLTTIFSQIEVRIVLDADERYDAEACKSLESCIPLWAAKQMALIVTIDNAWMKRFIPMCAHFKGFPWPDRMIVHIDIPMNRGESRMLSPREKQILHDFAAGCPEGWQAMRCTCHAAFVFATTNIRDSGDTTALFHAEGMRMARLFAGSSMLR